MYAAFYNLSAEPFQVTPDPRFLYPSESHKEAYASIVYGVEQRRGFISVVGEVGTGKTTILRTYLEEADRDRIVPIYLFNPDLTFDELVREIAAELRVLYSKASRTQIVTNIHAALVNNYKQGKNVVLIIDEAQNMPVATLESLRMLSNIETTQNKLLQVVLAGQPELADLLERNELRQLKQRIAVRSTIRPLTERESIEYIQSRLEHVAQNEDPVFTPAAIRKIVRYAKGIPRNINVACDSTLINGYGHRKRPATAAIVDEALAPFANSKKTNGFSHRKWAAATALMAAVGTVAWFLWLQFLPKSDVSAQEHASIPAVAGPALRDETAENSISLIPGAAATNDTVTFDGRRTETPPVQLKSDNPLAEMSAGTPGLISNSGNDPGPSESVSDAALEPSQTESEESPAKVDLTDRLWNPAPLPDEIFPERRTFETGSVLSQFCLEIYGFITHDLYVFIATENSIQNFNEIGKGQTIVFPALTPELQQTRSKYIQQKLRRSDTTRLYSETSG